MSELSIKLDYLPNRARPAEVFEAMALYIEAYGDLVHILTTAIGLDVDLEFCLKDVEKGSVLSLLSLAKNNLKKSFFDAVCNGANKTLSELTGETNSEDSVEKISTEFEKNIVESSENIIAPPVIDRVQTARALKKFSTANSKLMKGETIKFKSDSNCYYALDSQWRFTGNPELMFAGDVEHFEKVQGKFSVIRVINEGNAVWSFRSIDMDKRIIQAKITHKDWLDQYQSGMIPPIGPNDLIEAEFSYDIFTPSKGKGASTIRNAKLNYVISIIRNRGTYQYDLGD